jgi:hypothetical protein
MIQDWAALVDELNSLLKLRTIPFGMKMFERREDMEAIPKIRRPRSIPLTRLSVRHRVSAGPSASPATISSARNAAPWSGSGRPRPQRGSQAST